MLEAESRGLQELMSNGIPVPHVISSGQDSGIGFLLMEFLEVVEGHVRDFEQAGILLAHLHLKRHKQFGLHTSNFIGAIPQDNAPTEDWIEFYVDRRIEPLVKAQAPLLGRKILNGWFSLKPRLPELIKCDHPAMLHGDLWGGNYLITDHGPVFIDPAIYRGDPLMDIAMTQLFGGFPRAFYDAYFEMNPVSNEELWAKIPLYKLYYLLVHVALFGRSYVGSVERVLKPWI